MENSVLIASGNKHKIEKLRGILETIFDKVLTFKDIKLDLDIDESGATFSN